MMDVCIPSTLTEDIKWTVNMNIELDNIIFVSITDYLATSIKRCRYDLAVNRVIAVILRTLGRVDKFEGLKTKCHFHSCIH